MRKLIVIMLLSAVSALAQTAKPATGKVPKVPVTAPAKASTAKPGQPAAVPQVTNAEVDSFLQHMFGFQTGATWKILDIAPAEMPGVTRVIVQLGNQSQAMYVMPGGRFAMVGEVLPFGADPFGPARTQIATEAQGPVGGNPAGKVTVVEFSDLQCPHCKTAQPIIERLVAESPNARLIYQPFPLPMHPWAMQAAEYSECVHETSKDAFWKFIDSIYQSQADITEANATEKLNGLASSAGADAASVATCAAQPQIAGKIKKSIDLGLTLGVNSTPTLFIEGRKVLGVNEEALPSLKAMIEYEARQAKK